MCFTIATGARAKNFFTLGGKRLIGRESSKSHYCALGVAHIVELVLLAHLEGTRLVSQFVLEQRRPCWRNITGRETLAGGERVKMIIGWWRKG